MARHADQSAARERVRPTSTPWPPPDWRHETASTLPARAEQGLRRVIERDVEVVGHVAAGPEDRGSVEPDLHVFVMEQVESNDVPLSDDGRVEVRPQPDRGRIPCRPDPDAGCLGRAESARPAAPGRVVELGAVPRRRPAARSSTPTSPAGRGSRRPRRRSGFPGPWRSPSPPAHRRDTEAGRQRLARVQDHRRVERIPARLGAEEAEASRVLGRVGHGQADDQRTPFGQRGEDRRARPAPAPRPIPRSCRARPAPGARAPPWRRPGRRRAPRDAPAAR